MHACVWPGCERALEPHLMLCGEHWKTTPFELRRGLRASWDSGVALEEQPLVFKRAYFAFEQWIRTEFNGAQERHDPGRWERLKQFVKDRDARRKTRAKPEENPDGTEA